MLYDTWGEVALDNARMRALQKADLNADIANHNGELFKKYYALFEKEEARANKLEAELAEAKMQIKSLEMDLCFANARERGLRKKLDLKDECIETTIGAVKVMMEKVEKASSFVFSKPEKGEEEDSYLFISGLYKINEIIMKKWES